MAICLVLKELGLVTGPTGFSTFQPGAANSLRQPLSFLHCNLELPSSIHLRPGCRAPSVLWILEPHLTTPGAAPYSEI